MQEEHTNEIEVEMPTKFFLSEGHLKKGLIKTGILTLVLIVLFFFLLPYFFSNYTFFFIMGMIYTIFDIVALQYWYKRWTMPIADQPVITINESCVKIGYEEESTQILLDDIALAEIKKNFFGRKQLHLVYSKELSYKIKYRSYFKFMSISELNMTAWSQKWNLSKLSVELEELVQCINYHLDQYKTLT